MDLASVEQGNQSNFEVTSPPPSYENAVKDSPPSYQSLFSDLKKTKQESNGYTEFASKAAELCCSVICGSVAILVILGLITAIPIAMIVMGSIHLNDCPAERYIPIYLIVCGAFGLLSALCNMCSQVGKEKENGNDSNDEDINSMSGINCLISCFLLAWFIAGNVWVYRTHEHYSDDPLASNYCHPTLYLFAFWLLTSTYIFIGAIFLVTCLCFGVS